MSLKMRKLVTATRLRQLFKYQPTTGKFIRRTTSYHGTFKAGSVAGTKRSDGRYQINVDYKTYLTNRLAWLYMTGAWPAKLVDHKNLNKGDDRWTNLRLATKRQNATNCARRSFNKSGFKGVTEDKRYGTFRAYIAVESKQQYLGSFTSAKHAHAAYCQASTQYHGEFGRFN